MRHSKSLAALGVTMGLMGLGLIPLAVERASASEPTYDTRPAVAAAEAWLNGIDAGGYAASWDQAAELFRKAVPRDSWAAQVKGVREPLGALEARRLHSTRRMTSLPGAPDGHYVVIEFEARYARKARATETVTPVREEDGAWRVAGYYIR